MLDTIFTVMFDEERMDNLTTTTTTYTRALIMMYTT